jgi:hypothetical protein
MTGNIKRSAKVRAYVDEVVKDCKPGTTIFTCEIAAALCVKLQHGESMRDVGTALKERDDVRLVRTGTWEKL